MKNMMRIINARPWAVIIAAIFLFAGCLLNTSTCSASAAEEDCDTYWDEFFELSLEEIEAISGDTSSLDYDNAIYLFVQRPYWNQLIDELLPQKDIIGNDYRLFRDAFRNLLLEKLHLKGIYDTLLNTPFSYDDLMNDLTFYMPITDDPFTDYRIEKEPMSTYEILMLDFNAPSLTFEFEYQGNTVSMSSYEVTKRVLYVINTYAETDPLRPFFAQQVTNLKGPDTTTTTTAAATTTTTTTTVTTAAATTTAGSVATGDASVFYLMLAGISAVAALCFARKRKSASA